MVVTFHVLTVNVSLLDDVNGKPVTLSGVIFFPKTFFGAFMH